MLKSTYRKFHSYFSSECYSKDMVKICSEWNRNCWNYAVCCFKKHVSQEFFRSQITKDSKNDMKL